MERRSLYSNFGIFVYSLIETQPSKEIFSKMQRHLYEIWPFIQKKLSEQGLYAEGKLVRYNPQHKTWEIGLVGKRTLPGFTGPFPELAHEDIVRQFCDDNNLNLIVLEK